MKSVSISNPGGFPKFLLILLAGFVLVIYGSCNPRSASVMAESEEPHYHRGKRLVRENRNAEALEAFLKVIEKRKDAPESHLEAGRISLDHLKDPITAIYHFRKYLENRPEDTEKAELVHQLIETAEKEFARSLPGKPFESQLSRLDLDDKVQQLQSENLQLKQRIAGYEQKLDEMQRALESVQPLAAARFRNTSEDASIQPNMTVSSNEEGQSNDGPSRPTTYTVEEGDSLSKISQKMYGTSARWMDIYQANKDKLSSPHDLIPGEEIRIP